MSVIEETTSRTIQTPFTTVISQLGEGLTVLVGTTAKIVCGPHLTQLCHVIHHVLCYDDHVRYADVSRCNQPLFLRFVFLLFRPHSIFFTFSRCRVCLYYEMGLLQAQQLVLIFKQNISNPQNKIRCMDSYAIKKIYIYTWTRTIAKSTFQILTSTDESDAAHTY